MACLTWTGTCLKRADPWRRQPYGFGLGSAEEVIHEGGEAVQMFLHDFLLSHPYMTAAVRLEVRSSPQAVVLPDNAHATCALIVWAERTGRRFAFFA